MNGRLVRAAARKAVCARGARFGAPGRLLNVTVRHHDEGVSLHLP